MLQGFAAERLTSSWCLLLHDDPLARSVIANPVGMSVSTVVGNELARQSRRMTHLGHFEVGRRISICSYDAQAGRVSHAEAWISVQIERKQNVAIA